MNKAVHYLNYNLATIFGIGLSPYAPGTLGAAVGVVIAYFFFPNNFLYQLALVVGLTGLSIYTSGWLAESEGDKDPSQVIIDEVAGQLCAFLFVPVLSWQVLLVGFILFRIFDIWKPWPVSRFEALPGGLGITLDDIAAGFMANIIIQVWLRFF